MGYFGQEEGELWKIKNLGLTEQWLMPVSLTQYGLMTSVLLTLCGARVDYLGCCCCMAVMRIGVGGNL